MKGKTTLTNPVIARGRKAEILLIEDNLGDELLALRAFKSSKIDYNFRVAGTAEEALSLLGRLGQHAGQALPDIILLDLNLPKMSGKTFLALVKEDPDLNHIPVVVMTSSEALIDVKRCRDLHASAYIVKPMDLDAFKEVVATIEQIYLAPARPMLPTAALVMDS